MEVIRIRLGHEGGAPVMVLVAVQEEEEGSEPGACSASPCDTTGHVIVK